MFHGGSRSLEDLRQIGADTLREILPLERIASSDAFGEWLRKRGENGSLHGLEQVSRKLLKWCMKYNGITNYTLDIDAIGIEAEKQTGTMTYKGFPGYMPMVVHLAENGLVAGDEFREDNVSLASRNLAFIKYCVRQMPKGKKITALRSDSAGYQDKIINYCELKECGLPSELISIKGFGVPLQLWRCVRSTCCIGRKDIKRRKDSFMM
jgi:hypothetical protein